MEQHTPEPPTASQSTYLEMGALLNLPDSPASPIIPLSGTTHPDHALNYPNVGLLRKTQMVRKQASFRELDIAFDDVASCISSETVLLDFDETATLMECGSPLLAVSSRKGHVYELLAELDLYHKSVYANFEDIKLSLVRLRARNEQDLRYLGSLASDNELMSDRLHTARLEFERITRLLTDRKLDKKAELAQLLPAPKIPLSDEAIKKMHESKSQRLLEHSAGEDSSSEGIATNVSEIPATNTHNSPEYPESSRFLNVLPGHESEPTTQVVSDHLGKNLNSSKFLMLCLIFVLMAAYLLSTQLSTQPTGKS